MKTIMILILTLLMGSCVKTDKQIEKEKTVKDENYRAELRRKQAEEERNKKLIDDSIYYVQTINQIISAHHDIKDKSDKLDELIALAKVMKLDGLITEDEFNKWWEEVAKVFGYDPVEMHPLKSGWRSNYD